jgi:hypothetical protein
LENPDYCCFVAVSKIEFKIKKRENETQHKPIVVVACLLLSFAQTRLYYYNFI